MVAPTPVSALLHAVAVVEAGVFTMLKVGIYIFGIEFLAETGASTWLMWLAAASIIIASLIAMTKDNLTSRRALDICPDPTGQVLTEIDQPAVARTRHRPGHHLSRLAKRRGRRDAESDVVPRFGRDRHPA